MLKRSQSRYLYNIFVANLSGVFAVSANVDGKVLHITIDDIKSEIDSWINELNTFIEDAWNRYDSEKDESGAEFVRLSSMGNDILYITMDYNNTKAKLDEMELEFQNTVRLYHVPVRSALTDIHILYNNETGYNGDFSGMKNVSVYIHGIESTSNEFLIGATEGGQEGDIIVHMRRDGTILYYVIHNGKAVLIRDDSKLTQLKEEAIKNNGRLHLLYDTEQMNEHRQETSDDLARKLNNLGLLNDETKIDMFAHSYGGRRSLQFAMDYPDHVRSITTIGTPYDTNMLGSMADNVRWLAEWIGQNPKEASDYLDFNLDNQNDVDGLYYSNAYTDLNSEPMTEDLHNLKAANPEVYEKLLEMEITAAAGYRIEYTYTHSPINPQRIEYKTNSDDTVSVESQNGEILGDLIDYRPQYEIEDGTGVTNPSHIYEIEDEDFRALISEINVKMLEEAEGSMEK